MKIFLSYADEDRSTAEQIYLALMGAEHEVFFDKTSLPPGGTYHDKIRNAVKKSDLFIFLITTHSVTKGRYALTELQYARGKWPHPQSRVLPVLLSATNKKLIPRYLKEITILEPEGNVAAETLTFVANLQEQLNSPEVALDQTAAQVRQDHRAKSYYNLVIFGKAGAGKSSLINYLYGRNVVESGVGKPVTTRSFSCINFENNGIPIMLFDSRGLETGGRQAEDWIADLHGELHKRGTDQPVERWFHTVLYCIAASSKRVEDFELSIIRKLQQEKYRVVVVFTKFDLASDESVGQLRSVIQDELGKETPFVSVASVSEKLRSGPTKQEGRDNLLAEIYTGFWESISYRLPDRCTAILRNLVNNWRRSKKQYITKNATARNAQEIADVIHSDARKLIDLLKGEQTTRIINSEIEQTLQLYQKFAEMVDLKSTENFQTLTFPRVRFPKYKDPEGFFAEIRRMFNFNDDAKEKLIELVEKCVDSMNIFINRIRPHIEKIIEDSVKKNR